MAKREKPQAAIAPIGDVAGADRALSEIAEIDRAVEAANHQLNEDIDNLKRGVQEEIAPLLERKEMLGAGLANFAEISKAELFKDRKSKELDFGTIGYRKSTSLAVMKKICSTWKEVLGKLRQYDFKEAIRVKEEPDKEVMAEWPMERLELVGVQRVEKDEFFYEIKQEKVAAD
ncbi:MAG: host-nuclease inhibitor Gam family protein [Synergistaceae bacterium]|jgi:phage host-nuclease inhibitor protein Gam|nr:host-nuclease inhibitor Gam family protein [Synergistaceae bacterium]